MPGLRRLLAGTAVALALTALPPVPAQATVVSASGATADTTLVCQRLWGSYVVSVRGAGFHYARAYVTNGYTGQAGWTGWTPGVYGSSTAITLPKMGSVAVYVQYAYWNGRGWEYAGEWAKVYNARGQFSSYWC